MLALVLLVAATAAAPAPASPAAAQPAASSAAPPAGPKTVEAAVAELRRVVVADIPEGERRAKQERCGEAEKLLSESGEAGCGALEAELRKMRAAGEKDTYFQATAAQVLFRVRGIAGAPAVAEAVRGVDPETEIMYLWELLSAAAATRDARALPLLRIALATDEDASPVLFLDHGMTIPWPFFLWFTYGMYGRDACSDLQAAAAGADARVAVSAVHAIGSLRCPAASPLLRGWAAGADAARAPVALRALGTLGDPADRALFLACPGREPAEVRRVCAYGAVELGDPALVPAFLKLATDEDAQVRREAVIGLLRLPTVEGGRVVLAALKEMGEEAKGLEQQLRDMGRWNDVDGDALLRGEEDAWKRLAASELERTSRTLARRPGDPVMTRASLEKTVATWEKEGRVGGDLEAQTRSLLAIATPDDLPALFRARARVLLRQSDESMDELEFLEHVIKVLDRRRLGVKYPNR